MGGNSGEEVNVGDTRRSSGGDGTHGLDWHQVASFCLAALRHYWEDLGRRGAESLARECPRFSHTWDWRKPHFQTPDLPWETLCPSCARVCTYPLVSMSSSPTFLCHSSLGAGVGIRGQVMQNFRSSGRV